MNASWTWTYQDADGKPASVQGLDVAGFPTQSDAESWLGEEWQTLAEAGAESVTLLRDGEAVYGPMSLRAAE
jgi:hypothetical protein